MKNNDLKNETEMQLILDFLVLQLTMGILASTTLAHTVIEKRYNPL